MCHQLIKLNVIKLPFPVLTKNDSSHTGMVIGIMTSIIIALAIALAVIIGISVHNVKKTAGRSVPPPSFGEKRPVTWHFIYSHYI